MKTILFFGMGILALTSCGVSPKLATDTPGQTVEVVAEDSLEYELLVLDPGFDSFLMMQPPPEFHSQAYYENWNFQYVVEWNNRHYNSLRYGDFYQTEIHYDPHKDYGLELNYQLYYYFRFIEQNYGVKLIRRR